MCFLLKTIVQLNLTEAVLFGLVKPTMIRYIWVHLLKLVTNNLCVGIFDKLIINLERGNDLMVERGVLNPEVLGSNLIRSCSKRSNPKRLPY